MGEIPSWIGARVGDCVGKVVGTVRDVYCDDVTARPAWFLVDTEKGAVLVPADGSLSWSDRVVVAHDRELIDAAPVVSSTPTVLAGEPLLRMARHYGLRINRCSGCVAVRGPASVAQAA